MGFILFLKSYGGVVGVFRNEPGDALFSAHSFYGQFPIDRNHHDFSILCRQAAVDHQKIPIMYARPDHGISPGPGKKGGGWLANEVGIEVEGTLRIVIRWGRKSRGHSAGIQGKLVLAFAHEAQNPLDLADWQAHRPGRLSVLVAPTGPACSFSSSSLVRHRLLKYVTEFKKSKPFI
jgi:hypothetical protein